MPLIPQDKASQKKLLAVVAPLLALLGYWYFLHGDRVAEIQEMETHLETLEQQNTAARSVAARGGADLEDRLGIYEEYMARLERLIPSSEEVPQLLYDISERAEQVGVDLALVRPGPDAPGQYYVRQTFEMAVLGRYHDIGRFLSEIGSLPRIITPIDVEIEVPGGRDARQGTRQENSLRSTFRIETYVLPPEGAAPADTTNARGNART